MEHHEDFKQVYFRYKQLIGEGFDDVEQMEAAMR
jgi:hypothetical protein